MTETKTLTEMIETSEPDEWLIEKDTHRAYHVAQSIVNDPRKRLRPLVDRASYDKLKAVAIELAKACERISVGPHHWMSDDEKCANDAISRAKDILRGV